MNSRDFCKVFVKIFKREMIGLKLSSLTFQMIEGLFYPTLWKGIILMNVSLYVNSVVVIRKLMVLQRKVGEQ